jgi:hypothetical protein
MGFDVHDIHLVTQGLMDANAFHTNSSSSGYRASERHAPLLNKLEELGLVQSVGDVDRRWFFTELGISRAHGCSLNSDPTPVFRVREGIPLADCTNYELLRKLQVDGWAWRQWLAPSSRPRGLQDGFGPYTKGAPKVWYSGKVVSRPYVLALLDSESLFEKGLTELQHGLSDADYNRFLRGDIQLRRLALCPDMPPDIEGDGGAPPETADRPLVKRRRLPAAAAAAADDEPADEGSSSNSSECRGRNFVCYWREEFVGVALRSGPQGSPRRPPLADSDLHSLS